MGENIDGMGREKVYIKKSHIGKGLFAKKDFKKGEELFKINGIFFLVKDEFKFDQKTIANSFRYSQSKYLNPKNNFGDFLNHSCNPNSTIRKIGNSLYVFSIKEIFAQKEILIDYSTIIAEDDFWKMDCFCKEKNCRKFIEKFSLLPKEIQEKYISLGAVPDYIFDKNQSFKPQNIIIS